MKLVYLIARIVFGGWFLFSGLEYFTPFNLQPLGDTALAREFTLTLIHIGLFKWIKVLEVVVGALVLINRGVLPAALAIAPVTVVICYWNFILNPGVVEYSFGVLTALFNAVLLWPQRERLWSLLIWRSDRP